MVFKAGVNGGGAWSSSIDHMHPFPTAAHPLHSSVDPRSATQVVMLSEHEEVMEVEDALRSTHNGFPVVHTTWSKGTVEHHLRGFVTRHQLLTLLSRRELVAADTLRPLHVGVAQGSHTTGGRAGGSLTGLAAMAAPTPITAEHAEIDSAMRTFFHRHSFYNRHTMTGPAIVDRLGLTPEDRRLYVDLGPYMNIAVCGPARPNSDGDASSSDLDAGSGSARLPCTRTRAHSTSHPSTPGVLRSGYFCHWGGMYASSLTKVMRAGGEVIHSQPMTVQMTCSWWKAYALFRKLGLRHLSVVDDCNRVRGILTRKDFHVLEAH
jgi:hypothetical protein